MKNIDSFSMTRVANVIRWAFMTNWKANILFFITLLAALVILTVAQLYPIAEKDYTQADASLSYSFSIFSLYLMVFLVLHLLSTSTINRLENKESRITMLQLPASIQEKFAARVIYCVVIVPLVACLEILIADALHNLFIVFSPEMKGLSGMALFNPEFWDFTVGMVGLMDFSRYIFIMTTCFLCVESFYAIGGTFWYKRAFIKTTALLGVALVTFAFLVSVCSQIFPICIGRSLQPFMMPVCCFLWILIALNWCIAYHFFKRTSVLDRKFLGIL